MKRIYREAAWRSLDDAFDVTLDDRPLRTPARRPIILPTEDLAREVAREWQEQTDEIRPETMPLTRLVTTAIDRVALRRREVEKELAGFAASDLVCYRAEVPASLVDRQAMLWQPLVDWVSHRYDAALTVTSGIIPVDQPDSTVATLTSALAPLSDLEIMAVYAVTAPTGSLVIGLAVVEGELVGEAAWEAGLADDLYMNEAWGEDEEAMRRQRILKGEILAAERLLHLIGRLPVGSLAAPHNR